MVDDNLSLRRAVLTGIGAYLPAQIVTNADMAARVETSDDWITERTGIKQRHFAAPHETAAFMLSLIHISEPTRPY